MTVSTRLLVPAVAVLAGAGLASAQTITTTAGPSRMTSTSTLRLAKMYSGNNFFEGFNFETADDPTGGYVNYVNEAYARSEGLVDVQADGAVIMRIDSSQRATGRGRDSIRLSSKNEYADGVYILDVNHLPVGCGVWPAWWTTIKNGWPTGGEIDMLEGANPLPSRYGAAWNATGNITAPTTLKTSRNTVSIHTNFNCTAEANTYMTGALDANTCSAFIDGNKGCGVNMGGKTTFGVDSFGSNVNDVGGGWYALWRDMAGSGGAYVYFWPRNSTNVPDDVRYSNATTTSVQNWGQPGANLTAPGCKDDIGNHVIVFNMALCGDYSAATWGSSGCPTTQTCPTFVMNNPGAFAEAYWSINSLRIYTASGSPVTTPASGLTSAQIGGIAGGAAGFVLICAFIFWRYRVTKRKRIAAAVAPPTDSPGSEDELKQHNQWANPDELPPLTGVYVADPNRQRRTSSIPIATAKPRTGRTHLAPGKTARHHLDGETASGFYHTQASSLDTTPNASSLGINQVREQGSINGSAVSDPRPGGSRRASVIDRSRLTVSIASGPATSSIPGSLSPATPRRGSTYGRPESRLSSHSFTPATSSLNRRDSAFQGERSGGSWVG